MSVNILYCNPFALPKAEATWKGSSADTSLKNRCFQTTKAVFQDLYIDNPYNLTIGNIKHTFYSPEIRTRTKLEKVACIAISLIGACYTLILYASNFYLIGKLIEVIGVKTTLPFLTKTGLAVQTVAEKIFLAGAVPLYGIFYVLPQKAMQSIPRIVQFTIQKTVQIATWMFKNILQPLWIKMIKPVLSLIGRGIEAIGTIVCKAVATVAKKTAQIATWMFKNILQPMWSLTLTSVSKVISFVGNTLTVIATKVAQSANWIFQHTLVPLWNYVISPISTAIVHGFKFIAGKVAQFAVFIFKNLLTPCLNAIKAATTVVGKVLWKYLITPIGKSVGFIADKIRALAKLIFDGCLWIGKVIGSELAALGNKVYHVSQAVLAGIKVSWNKATSFFKFKKLIA